MVKKPHPCRKTFKGRQRFERFLCWYLTSSSTLSHLQSNLQTIGPKPTSETVNEITLDNKICVFNYIFHFDPFLVLNAACRRPEVFNICRKEQVRITVEYWWSFCKPAHQPKEMVLTSYNFARLSSLGNGKNGEWYRVITSLKTRDR